MSATETEIGKSPARRPLRERFPFFVFLSSLIHASLILLLGVILARRILHSTEESPPPPEVTLEITPPDPADRPTVEAVEVTDNPPENAPFQSDRNSKASAELPPEGTAPVPTQQGVALPSLELRNQPHTQGDLPAANTGNTAPPSSPSATQSPPTQPKEQSTPQATPLPTPPALKTEPVTIQEKPPAKLPDKEIPLKQSPLSPASPANIQGSQGARKGYQPESRQTVIKGNISNRGRSSVAAEATPIGRYKKAVADAIGSRWYYYVQERMGLLSIGSVDVSFKVTRTGKVTQLHVTRSNSNESLTDCSIRSIMDAKLPQIPPDVAATLQSGCLEIDYSFTIY